MPIPTVTSAVHYNCIYSTIQLQHIKNQNSFKVLKLLYFLRKPDKIKVSHGNEKIFIQYLPYLGIIGGERGILIFLISNTNSCIKCIFGLLKPKADHFCPLLYLCNINLQPINNNSYNRTVAREVESLSRCYSPVETLQASATATFCGNH